MPFYLLIANESLALCYFELWGVSCHFSQGEAPNKILVSLERALFLFNVLFYVLLPATIICVQSLTNMFSSACQGQVLDILQQIYKMKP